MSESLKIIKRNHYPVRVRLSAVRDRLINELDYAEVLTKYGVSSSTFGNWLKKYKIDNKIMSIHNKIVKEMNNIEKEFYIIQ